VNVRFAATPFDLSVNLLAMGVGSDLTSELSELESRMPGLRAWLLGREFKGKAGEHLSIPGEFAGAGEVLLVGVGERSADDLREAAAAAGRAARDIGALQLALALGGGDVTTLVEFALIGNYAYDEYATSKTDRLEGLTLVGTAEDTAAANAALVRAKWQDFCRDLVNGPPADIYPGTMASKAQALGDLPNVTVDVWDWERCIANNLVGIQAVGRGSSRPGNLIHLSYRPENARDHIALVGKGVTFDAGGLSLKPSAAMQTMRCDMGGAATALAAFGAIAELGVDVAVDCWLPCVENMCAADSFKLGDILRYNNGVTVEIHNTDAEGRLVLADALIEACKVDGVTKVVDLATLTGACVIALGSDFSAMFTHSDQMAGDLQSAANTAGELVWRMPLYEGYKKMLKGKWGQIKNIGGRPAGSTTAALYLEHFVADHVEWTHFDIAGTAFMDADNGAYRAGGTGQMVRTLVDWANGL